MKPLILALATVLTALSAFADLPVQGTAYLAPKDDNSKELNVIVIQGAAAAALYKSMKVSVEHGDESDLKKVGKNMTCGIGIERYDYSAFCRIIVKDLKSGSIN